MRAWHTPENTALLGRLLDDLDHCLAHNPPGDFLVVDNTNVAWPHLKECLRKTLVQPGENQCHAIIEAIAADGTPFMLFSHQFGLLRNLIVRQALERNAVDDARQAFSLLEDMEEEFASVYLRVFLNRLGTRNHLRLSHIRSLSDKNILVYFESHLEWIERLVAAVASRNPDAMPELDHTRCDFGCWLNDNDLIRDKSYTKQLQKLHESMHHVVTEISTIMDRKQSSAPIYALLRKAETYSLELGNEISLLNSIVIMSVYSKDPLTGFLTRRFMERVILNQLEIAKATETAFSLVIFDLDHFKQINDRHGHQAGDRVLEHVAGLVRETLRQSDLVFRHGGEEFLLVLPSTTLYQAHQLAERLRHRIAECPLPGTPDITVSASFGVAEISPQNYEIVDNILVRDLIAECDARLYAAKHRGRNRVV